MDHSAAPSAINDDDAIEGRNDSDPIAAADEVGPEANPCQTGGSGVTTRSSSGPAVVGVAHPVELLRDGKGIYGIGAAKWAELDKSDVTKIVLRPDRLDEHSDGKTIYQPIAGGFRSGLFKHTSEEGLRRALHHAMLRRAGLCWPPKQPEYYWSNDKAEQTRNRQIFHGLRLGSLGIVNGLIREALAEAAVPEAVKQARRFRFQYRQDIYRAGATSRRALQLIEVFPALALAIYSSDFEYSGDRRSIEAAALVERGARLRTIAGAMDIPMALRHVKPGAADLALPVVRHCPLTDEVVLAHLPASLPQMKLWILAVWLASRVGPEFLNWTARHAIEIAGSSEANLAYLRDTADWVTASRLASVPAHMRPALAGEATAAFGEQFVTRRFSPDMSLSTVKRLSDEWHEAVASNMDGPEVVFPDPWCEGGLFGDYEIRPITNGAELYLEGRAMHHCVGTHASSIRDGHSYIYSVRKHGNRVATAELLREDESVELGQLSGICNTPVGAKIERAVNQWLRAQRDFRLPKLVEVSRTAPECDVAVQDFIDSLFSVGN